MSNQVFSPARFARLWQAHWAESARCYLWFFVVLALLNAVALTLSMQDREHVYYMMRLPMQETWYGWGLFISGIVFATRYFECFSSKGSALIALMRPASAFEKWFLALLVVGLLYPLAYSLAYALMNYPVVAYAQAHVDPTVNGRGLGNFGIYLPFTAIQPQTHNNPTPHEIAVVASQEWITAFQYLAATALCLGGRVFFHRAAVLKTWLVAAGMFLLTIVSDVFLQVNIHSAARYWLSIQVPPNPVFNAANSAVAFGLLFIAPLVLWLALLLHIQEREVS